VRKCLNDPAALADEAFDGLLPVQPDRLGAVPGKRRAIVAVASDDEPRTRWQPLADEGQLPLVVAYIRGRVDKSARVIESRELYGRR
jgi:hypothetical protein